LMSSILFSSISSGRGEFRYSSSFWSVFKRPLSSALKKKKRWGGCYKKGKQPARELRTTVSAKPSSSPSAQPWTR
jgi:hypothetical protein